MAALCVIALVTHTGVFFLCTVCLTHASGLHRHLSFFSLIALERMDTINVSHKRALFSLLFK